MKNSGSERSLAKFMHRVDQEVRIKVTLYDSELELSTADREQTQLKG